MPGRSIWSAPAATGSICCRRATVSVRISSARAHTASRGRGSGRGARMWRLHGLHAGPGRRRPLQPPGGCRPGASARRSGTSCMVAPPSRTTWPRNRPGRGGGSDRQPVRARRRPDRPLPLPRRPDERARPASADEPEGSLRDPGRAPDRRAGADRAARSSGPSDPADRLDPGHYYLAVRSTARSGGPYSLSLRVRGITATDMLIAGQRFLQAAPGETQLLAATGRLGGDRRSRALPVRPP